MTTTWLDPLMRTPCVLVMRVPTGKDEYGNPTYTDEYADARCYVETSAVVETEAGRAGTDTWLVLLPGEFAGEIDTFAAIKVNGVWTEVAEPPVVYRRPRDPLHVHHIEVQVARSTAWGDSA